MLVTSLVRVARQATRGYGELAATIVEVETVLCPEVGHDQVEIAIEVDVYRNGAARRIRIRRQVRRRDVGTARFFRVPPRSSQKNAFPRGNRPPHNHRFDKL